MTQIDEFRVFDVVFNHLIPYFYNRLFKKHGIHALLNYNLLEFEFLYLDFLDFHFDCPKNISQDQKEIKYQIETIK